MTTGLADTELEARIRKALHERAAGLANHTPPTNVAAHVSVVGPTKCRGAVLAAAAVIVVAAVFGAVGIRVLVAHSDARHVIAAPSKHAQAAPTPMDEGLLEAGLLRSSDLGPGWIQQVPTPLSLNTATTGCRGVVTSLQASTVRETASFFGAGDKATDTVIVFRDPRDATSFLDRVASGRGSSCLGASLRDAITQSSQGGVVYVPGPLSRVRSSLGGQTAAYQMAVTFNIAPGGPLPAGQGVIFHNELFTRIGRTVIWLELRGSTGALTRQAVNISAVLSRVRAASTHPARVGGQTHPG